VSSSPWQVLPVKLPLPLACAIEKYGKKTGLKRPGVVTKLKYQCVIEVVIKKPCLNARKYLIVGVNQEPPRCFALTGRLARDSNICPEIY
jgi:hypothetical protein